MKNLILNDNGAVLIAAMVFLVILTLLGVYGVDLSNTEVSTAGNQESLHNIFYRLESVSGEGAVRLDLLNSGSGKGGGASVVQLLKHSPGWLDVVVPPGQEPSSTAYDLSVVAGNKKDANYPSAAAIPGQILAPYPQNWQQAKTSRIDPVIRHVVEPPGYKDVDDGGGDRIRFAVQDIGAAEGFDLTLGVRKYLIYSLYDVSSGTGKAFPGRMMVQRGYSMMITEPEEL